MTINPTKAKMVLHELQKILQRDLKEQINLLTLSKKELGLNWLTASRAAGGTDFDF